MKLKKISLMAISTFVIVAIVISSVAALGLSAEEPADIIYNAYSDYHSSAVSDSVWSYQYRTADGSGYIYNDLTSDSSAWGTNETGKISAVSSDIATGNPALCFIPSTNTSNELVLNFTAPYSGTLKIEMANGGVFATRNKNKLVNFSLLHNEKVIKSISGLDNTYGADKPFFGEPQALTVETGDIVRFAVGRNAAGIAHTYLNPEITYLSITDNTVKEEYTAADGYSIDADGQWRYYSREIATGIYNPLKVNSSGGFGVPGNGSIAKAIDPITQKPAVTLHSGVGIDAALAFVAPYSGTLELSMANGSVIAPESGFDGINFSIFLNDSLYFESHVNSVNNYAGHLVFDGTETFTVKAGDIFYFVVNANQNTQRDSTYLNPYFKYTDITDTDNTQLRFSDDDKIESTNLYKDSFDISWPSARGGVADYTYTVYISETPVTGIPEDGGIDVGAARAYSFKELESGTAYYVAVAASDGLSKAILYNSEPINTIGKMFVFNSYDDYAEESMRSPWNYAYSETGSSNYKDLIWSNGMWVDAAASGSVFAAASDLVTGNPALCVSPGSDSKVALIFTAPYEGTVNLTIANGGLFVPYNGEGNGYDGINFELLQNNNSIVKLNGISSRNCHSGNVGSMYIGRVLTEEIQLNLKSGDKLIFAVDKNKDNSNDMTFLNPEIVYTSVAEGALDLHFEEGKAIEAASVTDSSFTLNLPSVFGGKDNYKYKVYISDKPITKIPTTGGIDLGGKSVYNANNLKPYTNYYVAATVFDGENTASIINSKPIATIGNTYEFAAGEAYTAGNQPINSPWRYYAKAINGGELKELIWSKENNYFIAGGFAPSIMLSRTESDLVTGKSALAVHPDAAYDLVIAFISPYSGKITVDSANGGVFAPINGAAVNFDGINFSVIKNNRVIYSKSAVSALNSNGDRCFSAGHSITVNRGDIIYFNVNCNTAASSDITYFDPRVRYTYVNQGSDKFDFMPGAAAAVSDVKETSFKLNWSNAFSPLDGDITYEVYLSESPIKSKPNSGRVYKGTDLSVSCKGLKIGRRYYVYIIATDPSGAKAVLDPADPVKTAASVYDAHDDFNKVNGASVWNYTSRSFDGKTNKYVYTLLSYSESSGEYGNTTVGLIRASDSDAVTGRPALMLHPGTGGNAAALVFTAPYTGEISISLANGAVFCPTNGKEQGYDGISFTLLHGEKQLFRSDSVSAHNNEADKYIFADLITIRITQGEKLYFIVDANANNSSDVTYFDPHIEYNYISGGTGVVSLNGFISAANSEQESGDAVTAEETVSFRSNQSVAAANVTGEVFGLAEESSSDWIFIIAGALGFAVLGGAVILILNIKKRKI